MIKWGTEKYDVNGNMTYYETDDIVTEARSFVYDDANRMTYYKEDKYEEWRVYSDDGRYVRLSDNQGNERYIWLNKHNASIYISKEEFEEQRFKVANNPDIFKFELMEI